MKHIILEGVRDFDLQHTFECGQCFRWNRETDGSYTGIAFGKTIHIRQQRTGDTATLQLYNVSDDDYLQIWHDYFDFNRDYGKLKQDLASQDTILQDAVSFGHGIRILNQDPWETLVSFLLSQNSNIPRIKQCIESLCSQFGEPIGSPKDSINQNCESSVQEKMYYSFPTAERLAGLTLEELDGCRLGYRAKYLLETARAVAADGGKVLSGLRGADYCTSMDYLLSLSGVGPKVASCIMLFSLKKYNSFPVDVWVRKVMKQLYGLDPEDASAIDDFSSRQFGPERGLAQQYLFYYIRERERQC